MRAPTACTMLAMATLFLDLQRIASSQVSANSVRMHIFNSSQINLTNSAKVTAPPPCPCGKAVLCRSLDPQPRARPEVLAFHTPSIYTNPATAHKAEPFYFHHYDWRHITTVVSFVGTEGRPGHEEPTWDVSGYTRELICTAHQHNARMVAHIGHGAPAWPELLNSTWRGIWIGQIVDWFIMKQGMDGIQFDVEDLQIQYARAATDLVCELRSALTAALPGSTLTWCSDSSPSADPGYNFTRLSSCLDYFVVMEYSHGLGPAWRRNFESGLQSYISLDVPPSKLVYTLPWFGAQWVCQEQSGVNCTYSCYYRREICNATLYGARPISYPGYANIVEFVSKGMQVHYQPQLTPSPYVNLLLNGTSIRSRYEYDDPRSIRVKAQALRDAKVSCSCSDVQNPA